VGALLGLLIAGKEEHADEQAPALPAADDDPPTEFIDVRGASAPTQSFAAPGAEHSADQTMRLPRQTPPPGSGRHHLPDR
jgi:hypothetical protein